MQTHVSVRFGAVSIYFRHMWDVGWIFLDGSLMDLSWILIESSVDLWWILGGSGMDLAWIMIEPSVDLGWILS